MDSDNIMTSMHSVFTTRPEIADRTIIENDTAFAFLTNMPINIGHTLISPKRVVSKVDDLSQDELLDIFKLVSEVKRMLSIVFGAEGFNCAWNEGAKYGQSVPHFHLHIVPRTPHDHGIVTYEPREFLYRPGSREDTPEAELKVVADQIRLKIFSSSTR